MQEGRVPREPAPGGRFDRLAWLGQVGPSLFVLRLDLIGPFQDEAPG